MKFSFKWLRRKRVILICVNILLLVLIVAACIVSGRFRDTLESQRFAERFSVDGEPYGQASVFLADSAGLTEEELFPAVADFDRRLVEAGMLADDEDSGKMIWTYGYSAESLLSVKWENSTAEAKATGVGENFFMFHPLSLKSGTYFYGDDLMQDKVIIDEVLAWQLFGATDVAGMTVEIGGLPYIIAGVSAIENDFASASVYGDKPRIYLSYQALLLNDESAKITCLEVLMPSPIENFALMTAQTVFEGMVVGSGNLEIVENSTRFSAPALLRVIGNFGLRSTRQVDLTYPYWENAARIVEDYMALLLAIIIVLLVFPLASLVVLIVALWRGRRWHFSDLKSFIYDKLEKYREWKKTAKKRQ